jgi:hypothetical protein
MKRISNSCGTPLTASTSRGPPDTCTFVDDTHRCLLRWRTRYRQGDAETSSRIMGALSTSLTVSLQFKEKN